MHNCFVTRFAVLIPIAVASVSQAAVTVYQNVTTDLDRIFPNDGATDTTPTTIVADDITPTSGHAGELVTAVTSKVYNGSTTTVTFTPTLYFYKSDGVDGGPGTLLKSVVLNSMTLNANEDRLLTYSSSGIFTLPSGTFWAGMAFSGASAAGLNNLAQDLFDPPTTGSSDDLFFQTDGAATTASNPVGGLYNFGGAPVANFNWSFETTAVPEPASLAVVLLSIPALSCRRRV